MYLLPEKWFANIICYSVSVSRWKTRYSLAKVELKYEIVDCGDERRSVNTSSPWKDNSRSCRSLTKSSLIVRQDLVAKMTQLETEVIQRHQI